MELLLLGLTLGLGAGIAPGPLLALVVRATLERGFGAGVRVAIAPLVTDAPIVALCVLVLGTLPDGVVAALGILGGLFVLRLGVEALRDPAVPATDEAPSGDLLRGAVVNVLSPHPWLFWITVGGPILVDAGSVGDGVLFLAGFYSLLVGVKVALAAGVAAGRRRLLAGRGYAIAVRAAGVLLLVAGALLLADGVRALG